MAFARKRDGFSEENACSQVRNYSVAPSAAAILFKRRPTRMVSSAKEHGLHNPCVHLVDKNKKDRVQKSLSLSIQQYCVTKRGLSSLPLIFVVY